MPTTAIPGVATFHPRTAWEPGPGTPFYGDLRRDVVFNRTPGGLYLPGIQYDATHYTAAIDIPDGDPGEILSGVDGIRNLLRNAHWDYLTNRTGGGYRRLSDGRWFPGYPLGYSFAFDWLGGVWEIQGFDYQPAATGGWNHRALAFLMLTDRADAASTLMWQSHRAVAREAVRRGADITPARVWSHGWFRERLGTGTQTACCGDALEAQIRAGYGDFTRDDTGESDTMRAQKPKRAYDSRPHEQGKVDPDLAVQNANVPRATLAVNASREVVVGMTSEAEISIDCIGRVGAGGYLSVNDAAGDTSIVHWSTADKVEKGYARVQTPNGKITVTAHDGSADFAVDVWAVEP